MFRSASAIAVLVLLLTSMISAQADSFAENYVASSPPKPVPQMLLQDDKGQSFNLQDFHGKFIVLNLWATWCGPCAHEMPSLDRLQQKLGGKNFAVIALNEDHDGLNAAAAFFKRNAITALTVYADPSGRAPSLTKAHGLPTTLLINAEGLEVARISGEAVWDSPEAIAFLTAMMMKG